MSPPKSNFIHSASPPPSLASSHTDAPETIGRMPLPRLTFRARFGLLPTIFMPRKTIDVFTIGFTKITAEAFFEKLRNAGVKRVVDVRLNKKSQLAGFCKEGNLEYFLKKILNVEYVAAPLLAPTDELFTAYKTDKGSWPDYERAFLKLMKERRIEDKIDPEMIAGGCLLCSEHEPHHCHRRLVVDYLQQCWGNLKINHII